MKGHYIARTFTGLIGVFLIGYTIWLRMQQTIIVADGQEAQNMLFLALVLFLGVYFVYIVARPTAAPSNRWMLAVLWLVIILVAEAFLQDNPETSSYLKDILKIVGAMLVITWPMKLLITKEAEEKKYMEEVEIIEV